MERWIIFLMLEDGEPENSQYISDIIVTNEDGTMMIFDSLDEASIYQEEHDISGECFELPCY